MMRRCVLILTMSALAARPVPAFAAPAEPEPVLVLNSQWNLAYAKSACKSAEIWYKSVGRTAERLGCENFAACPKLLATAKACRAQGPTGPLRDFEQQIIASLTTDPACHGIVLVRYSGPGDAAYEKLKRGRDPANLWTLSVDFAPGAAQQSWRLQQRVRSASGDGEAKTIARQACTWILGHGAQAD